MARILWIDLCLLTTRHRLSGVVPQSHRLMVIDRIHEIQRAVREFTPQFACIEFDYPDPPRLRAVAEFRRTYPMLPIVVFTEYHSEAMAVWAFRSGVWDYRVKPVDNRTLARSMDVLAGVLEEPGANGGASGACLPADLIEPAGHLLRPPTATRKTAPAIAYIARHYHENLRRDTLARLCHVSSSEFSRVFRRENGVAFAHYLLGTRITMARSLLAQSDNTASQIAYAVGFNDPSYFCRVFRRLVGATAISYQQRVRLPTASAMAAKRGAH